MWPFSTIRLISMKKNFWLNLHENVVRDVPLDKEVPLNFGSHPCIEILKNWGLGQRIIAILSPWRRSALSDKYFRLFSKVSCFTNIFYNYYCVIEVLPHKFLLLYNITPHRTITLSQKEGAAENSWLRLRCVTWHINASQILPHG